MVDEPSEAIPATAVVPSPRHLWWAVPLAVVGFAALAVPLAAAMLPAKLMVDTRRCAERAADGECSTYITEPAEFAVVPANAEPVEPLLDISGTSTYASDGRILFVTVREPRLTMLDWLAVRDNPAARLRSRFEKYGGEPESNLLERGQRQMSGAKEWAIYVALTRAGLQPEFVPGKAVVDYVLCLRANDDDTECLEYPPANDFLRSNDVVVEADGTEIGTLRDLANLTSTRSPGDQVTLTVLRDGEEVTGTVTLIESPDEPGRPIIGFMPIDTTTLRLPDGVEVEFDTGDIGGPSAGLAFTLALLDDLTEGDLTGGLRIAVTGTINPDGTVGAIGGLSSKASAVRQVGARYFLVPASQATEGTDSVEAARRAAGPDVELIPVATLDEALEVLARLGGDPLPPATAG